MGARPLVPLGALAFVLLVVPPARAETPSEHQALELFDEGQALMAQRRYAEACDKFAESDRAASSGAAVANLADCLEKRGLLATAWRRFKEARGRALAANKREVVKFLDARIAALDPRVARLTLTLAPGDVDAHVSVDGIEVPPGEREGLPLEPGSHVVEITAPPKTPYKNTVVIAGGASRTSLVLAPLVAPAPVAPQPASEPAPGAAPPAKPEAPAPSAWGTQRTLALVAGGAGVVAAGVGAYFVLAGKSQNDQALAAGCAGGSCPTQGGVDASGRAAADGNVATVAFAASVVMAAGAVVLWLTAPSSAPRDAVTGRARVVPVGGPGVAGIAFQSPF
jgi:hypothetical protein